MKGETKMKITKERFNELGLGCDKDFCEEYGYLECSGCNAYEIAPCLDLYEESLRMEMTDAEYDALRHDRLDVE